MRERLQSYLEIAEAYENSYRASSYKSNDVTRELNDRAEGEEPTVRRILRTLDPPLDEDFLGVGYDMSNAGTRVRQALGVLRDRDEWTGTRRAVTNR